MLININRLVYHMPSNFKSDVQSETDKSLQALDWVGMGQIESALNLNGLHVPCDISLVVNLSEGNRGIHMSRLYALMMEQFLNRDLKEVSLSEFLKAAITSQEGLSDKAGLAISLKYPVRTQALKSKTAGHRNYPVTIAAVQTSAEFQMWLKFEILYSSTCPQSAALSLEAIKNKVSGGLDIKSVERLPATPHAQRSVMTCELLFSTDINKNLDTKIKFFIESVESVLKTPVQTAVKKADEMAFAELNSENLMFCEDAVRRIDTEFLSKTTNGSELLGYKIKTRHEESLHPHNAVSLKTYRWSANPLD